VESFQRSFPQDPGKFFTPFCTLVALPLKIKGGDDAPLSRLLKKAGFRETAGIAVT